MTGRQFFNHLANDQTDAVQKLLDLLAETGTAYCIIGGLAVNAYAEPVVSLDLDIVVAASHLQPISAIALQRGLKIERFEHSVNLSLPGSALRIQFQTDPRYQDFIAHGSFHDVLGYRLNVASLSDVLQGKVWAYLDRSRRASKRQKDLADILRLIEVHPELAASLPDGLRSEIQGKGAW